MVAYRNWKLICGLSEAGKAKIKTLAVDALYVIGGTKQLPETSFGKAPIAFLLNFYVLCV